MNDIEKMLPLHEFKTILDVGAHEGQSTLRYLASFPVSKITAFEPCAKSFDLLQRMFREDKRVAVLKFAVSDYVGEGSLNIKENNSTHSLLRSDKTVGTEKVEVSSLDAHCKNQGWPQIHFCKIDTEGNDLAVLRGASWLLSHHHIDFVQVETSTRRDTNYFSGFFEIDSLLCSFNYELFGIYEQQRCWTGRNSLLYFNAVYVRTSLIDSKPPL